ncbi:hypothetical protein NPIL_569621, partial [Nephila pilipes]
VVWRTNRVQEGRVTWCPIDIPSPLAPPADACGSKQESVARSQTREDD